MKKLLSIALVALVLVGCGGSRTTDKSLEKELSKLTTDIPVYPNGSVSTLDRDPFRIDEGKYLLAQGVLFFEDDLAKVASWYKNELEAKGWTIKNLEDRLILSNKNGIDFQLIFNEDDGKTKVIYFMNPTR
ncbi:MAG: hypothetical protein KA140_07530 [Caldisericia bacterium]|nr:hypothetical protein [Caldisericia bacterium]